MRGDPYILENKNRLHNNIYTYVVHTTTHDTRERLKRDLSHLSSTPYWHTNRSGVAPSMF